MLVNVYKVTHVNGALTNVYSYNVWLKNLLINAETKMN